MIKLLLVIDEASIGGGQQHLLWLASGLDRKEFEITVMCEGSGYLVEELKRRGIPVVPVSMTNAISFSVLMQCISAMRQIRPDIVHTHGGTAGFYGRLAARLASVRTIIHTYHGIHYVHGNFTLKKRILLLAEQMLKHITSVCILVCKSDVALAREHRLVSEKKFAVVYNGVDVAGIASVSGQSTDSIERVDFGTIGRLHEQKGQSFLLEAFALLHQKHQHIKMRIVGDGELRESLMALAERLNVAESVEFAGIKLNTAEQLNAMDCFVLPSLWEGLPLVMLEAMAAHKPIVATRVDGMLEIAEDHREAILVPHSDAPALAQAMETLLQQPALAVSIANAAFKKVSAKFSLAKMVADTRSVYHSETHGAI
jgi:glycosyltransferase involved in cell wall biosynthesis